MRISDWSSDVCSSDLLGAQVDEKFHALRQRIELREKSHAGRHQGGPQAALGAAARIDVAGLAQRRGGLVDRLPVEVVVFGQQLEIGRASCRERVWQYV